MGDVNDYERPLGGEYYGTRSNGRRRCCIAMAVGLLATVILIIAIAVPLSMKHKSQVNQPTGADAISAACGATLFPIVCNETMGTGNGNLTTNSRGMSTYAIQLAGNGVNQTLFAVLGINASSNLNVTGAVDTCLETLSLAGSYLASIYNDIQNETAVLEDIQAALYGAWELHTTCVDTFVEYAPDFSANVSAQGQQADQLLSNAGSLLNALVTFGNDLTQWKPTLYGLPDGLNFSSIVNSIPSSVENAFHNLTGGGNRRLLSNPDLVPETEEDLNQPPRWLNPSDRRLLAGSPSFYNAVVAKDGSGHYKTIQAAISAAPKNKQTRWVIWVKTGVYYENVVVQGGSINLFLIGDGIGKTVINGNRNVGCNCGMTTFLSATLGTYFLQLLTPVVSLARCRKPILDLCTSWRRRSIQENKDCLSKFAAFVYSMWPCTGILEEIQQSNPVDQLEDCRDPGRLTVKSYLLIAPSF
jgi:pectinesterase inhibitor-like protein